MNVAITEAEARSTGEIERLTVEPMVLKASGSAHVVVAVFCTFPFILGLAPQVLDRPPMMELLVIGGVLGFLALVWIRSFRIELTPTELRYRSLFGGSRSMAFAAIDRARIQVGFREGNARFKPRYRLVITPRTGAQSRPMVVNLKVFAFEPLKRVCAAVGAELDE